MKIGIITFWQTKDNYGQVLQAYALQTYLREIGHDPYIIRYNHDEREKYKKFKIFRRIAKVALIFPLIKYLKMREETKKLSSLIEYNNKKNKQRHFDEFRNKYFIFSDRVYNSLSDLQKSSPYADVFIAGSDQIWGKAWLLNNKENRVFFLDFGNATIKRIAYAPSFGMSTYPESCKIELSRQLSRFMAISSREKVGVEICRDAGYKAEWVCDPTLLLTTNEYLKLFNTKESGSKKLFVYCLNIQSKEEIFWDEITDLAAKNNLITNVTIGSGYIPASELFTNTSYDYSTIEGWLQNIYNSRFVITTSFHGIMFCILFHKNFAFVPLKGTHSSGNNRVIEILDLLGLKDHIVECKEDIDKIYKLNIDWEKVDDIINKFRKKSRNFLIERINN